MKLVILLAVVTYASAHGVDLCSRGPTLWCNSLENAKQCGAVEHCIDTVWSTTQLKNDKTDVCQFCENIITDVRNFVTDNATEAQVRDYFDSACALIPIAPLADQCKTTVDNNLDELFQLIASELDADAICTVIMLCGAEVGTPTTITTPTPKPNTTTALTTPTTTTAAPTTTTAAPKPSGYCAECKKIVSDLSALVGDNETVIHIDGFLEATVCGSLPDEVQAECNTVVEMFVPEIIALLASAIDADTICEAVHLCPGGDALLLLKMRLEKSPMYKALADSQVSTVEECTFCKIIFEELQELDRSTAVQEDVEDFVNTYLCAKLGSYKLVCENTVAEYGQMLFELLASELDPAMRCQSLGFCAAPKSLASEIIRAAMPVAPIVKETVPLKKMNSEGCVICEAVLMEIKNMLSDNDTEAELVADLEKICSILPASLKSQCNDFVETYGPAVVEMLLQNLDPKTVCQALGLCPAAWAKPQPRKTVGGDEYCGICETVIQYLDSILMENATEAEIKQDLERICAFLPDTIKQTCSTMVEDYMDAIIQFVAQGLTPEQVCTEIGLCSATRVLQNALLNRGPMIVPQKAQLVGTDECTYGPTYWCASQENAKRCGATEHCMAKVWV